MHCVAVLLVSFSVKISRGYDSQGLLQQENLNVYTTSDKHNLAPPIPHPLHPHPLLALAPTLLLLLLPRFVLPGPQQVHGGGMLVWGCWRRSDRREQRGHV